jgi:hypothetical protein
MKSRIKNIDRDASTDAEKGRAKNAGELPFVSTVAENQYAKNVGELPCVYTDV